MRWIGDSDANTSKKQRLNALIRRLREGPGSISEDPEGKKNYDLWLESWVIPELQELFPKGKIKKRDIDISDQHPAGGDRRT